MLSLLRGLSRCTSKNMRSSVLEAWSCEISVTISHLGRSLEEPMILNRRFEQGAFDRYRRRTS